MTAAPEARATRPAAPATSPGFAHRTDYAAWFLALARHADARAAQRRLIPHLDAALEPAARLALWQALWQTHRRLSAPERVALARLLDGRFAAALSALEADWGDPVLVTGIARLGAPQAGRARWVTAWLAHHGLDPLADPAAHDAALVMLAAQAAIDAAPSRLDGAAIASLQAAVLDAAGRAPDAVPQALALVFELALHARDEPTATGTLAELLHHGHAGLLRADRVGDWLDGQAGADDDATARPLRLAPALQRRWLQPAAWVQATVRQALLSHLRREGPRARLAALSAQLDERAATLGAPAAARRATPDAEALQALQALDAGYALFDAGADPMPALQPLLDTATLAPETLAALFRAEADHHARRGDPEAQALALLRARRHRAGPALHQALALALQGLGAPEPPPRGADGQAEAPYWQALAERGTPALRRLAHLALARLHTDGLLEPQDAPRRADWDRAAAHWAQLAPLATEPGAPPALATLVQRARQAEPWRSVDALRSHSGGREHLWVECAGAQDVLIVPACVASHHTWPEVTTLRGRLPGRHLLFLHNPEKNWYCDDAFDAVCAVVQARVIGRFAPARVSCWYGSMGGHGALKLALRFGFKAMVFNPQVDLDLWAAYRPAERPLLWGSTRHRSLLDAAPAAWAASPVYLACGSDTPDREALSLLLARWRELPALSLIVEKFDDPHHAGLMARISGGAVAPVLARIDQRLSELAGASPLPGMQAVPAASLPAFWQALDAEAACAVEVQVRDGRLWWQPSVATGTRRLAPRRPTARA